jgi:Lrp/AsnC family leucine-responsive transcriptional regulator
MPFAPDKTDLKILKLLQENGRITNLQLASSIGLSPAPTLERVRKLENSGFIKSYHAFVDEEKLGL